MVLEQWLRHVSEGGNPFDDFGKHISEMSSELNQLRKFKTYMNRSSVYGRRS